MDELPLVVNNLIDIPRPRPAATLVVSSDDVPVVVPTGSGALRPSSCLPIECTGGLGPPSVMLHGVRFK